MKWKTFWQVVLLMALLTNSSAYAEKYTIESEIDDMDPGDGFLEAGSSVNPYIVKNSAGDRAGTASSEIDDMEPGDGLLEAGSSMNPYVVETDD